MPSFILLTIVTAIGCLAFVGGLEITLADHEGLTTLLRVVASIAAVLGTNAAIAFVCIKHKADVKRPIVVGNVFLGVLLLLFLQNKVMVGTQEVQADVQLKEGTTYSIAFRDLAGVPINAGEREIQSLTKRLAGSDFIENIALAGEPVVTPDKRLTVQIADAKQANAFRDRVIGKPFLRQNAERGLVEVGHGIDLRGGVEFICQLYDDLGQRVSADDEVLHILRSRLDQRGLTEPTVTRLSNGDVQIVIPGGTPADAARTRKVIEQTGRLEFREVLAMYYAPTPGELPKEVIVGPTGNLMLSPEVSGSRKQVVAVDKSRDPNFKPVRFFHLGPAELTGKDVKNADRTIQEGRDAVAISFTATGGAKNYEFTRRLYEDRQEHGGDRGEGLQSPGKKFGFLAILFDGNVESAPVVQSPSNTDCVINGQFSPEEIDSLRAALKGGSLSVTPVVLSERVVGATLGMDAVRRAITTMLWCFVGILVFMGLYYRRLGIVAVLCMTITAALIWSTMSIFGAVLTLPGLAGLVLSIAMSMDTNVLVYERIREETRDGKDLATAIDLGYGRAFLAILDSNLTTIFSGIILYWVGTGPVKGFGLTLAVGVAVSMFSGVYIGRMLTELLCRGRDKVSMAALIPEPHLPYVRWRKASYLISFITGVLGLGYFCFGHLAQQHGTFSRHFDIDFTGGNLVQAIFSEPLSADQVKTQLQQAYDSNPENFGLLDPAELAQPQAYFATLAGGTVSRQWVFRGRDEAGAGLESARADLDQERGVLQKQIDKARDPDHANEKLARELEPQVAVLSGKISELEVGIAQRVQVFKQQISAAFPGQIPSEGSEIVDASWNDRSLSLQLVSLNVPEQSQVRRVQSALAEREELESVVVTSVSEPAGLSVVATYREAPTATNLLTEGPITDRLLSLLAPTAGEQSAAVTVAGVDLLQAVVQSSATASITVAQSFPASQHFSGQVAGAMKRGALLALSLATLAMLAYIAARFEIGFGIAAIVAMFHDLGLTLGLIALFGLRIDLTVIAALLTLIGYSVNDTIVTFDRIRENLKIKSHLSLPEIIDLSVAQTMPRTVLTGGATMLAIGVMMLFAGDALFAFNATLLIGAILGTYSSIFVAAPLLLSFDRSKLMSPEPERPQDPSDGNSSDEDDGMPPALPPPAAH